ncbi:MAG: DMT family transporter [Candidatus Paceibacterota bacterium]|jgi:drug/metabolite transporter (DMT)-like permease
MQKNNYSILFLILLAAVFGATTGVLGKIVLEEIPSFSFTFLRFFIASIFLIPFSLKHLPTFKKKDWKIILLSLLASLNVILFSFGIKHTTANMSQMIYSAVPIISAILSFYILKEKFGFNKIIGIIIGFIGTITIILMPLISNNSGGTIIGNFIITIAMLSISLYWVLSKKIKQEYSSIKINNYFIATTTILLIPFLFFDLIKNSYWIKNVSTTSYLYIVFIAVFGTAICYLINQVLIKKTTPVMNSMILYLQPFITFLLAYLFLSEKLTILFIIGVVLSLFGIGIYNFSIKKSNSATP